MITEENKEEISVEKEKKIKKISTIIMVIIIVFGFLVLLDATLVKTANIGPFLAIRTKVYNDGGTKEYYGLGYKVIKYNQEVGRKDTVIGTWSLKYNTTPLNFTLETLAYSIQNNNNTYKDSFIRVSGTINKIDTKNKTITLQFTDNEKGKYNLTVEAKVLSKLKDLKKDQNISLIGTVTSYDKNTKVLTISNAFAK